MCQVFHLLTPFFTLLGSTLHITCRLGTGDIQLGCWSACLASEYMNSWTWSPVPHKLGW